MQNLVLKVKSAMSKSVNRDKLKVTNYNEK